MTDLVLASASPRRRQFLDAWGLPHRLLPADIEEPLDFDPDPRALARELARRKAWASREKDQRAPARDAEPAVYLAADTVVSVGATHLGKPVDDEDALSMLLSISGQEVAVTTGVAVLSSATERAETRAVVTILQMHAFTPTEARGYVATGEPADKAGAFAIQGEGGALIAERRGSFSNVVGLPREETLALLASAGVHPRPASS